MKKILFYSLTLYLIALLSVGCALFSGEKSVEEAEVVAEAEVAIIRYGVDVEGYELREGRLRSGESLGGIMDSYGRTARDIDRVDRSSRSVFSLRDMRAGDKYVAFIGKDSIGADRLDYIAYERDRLNYVLFVMRGDSVSTHLAEKPSKVMSQRRVVTINHSLWSAIMEAKMPHDLGILMEQIFQWSIDFFDIREGDKFSVIYDERFVEDSLSVGVVAIRGIKFTHNKKDHYAIPFKQAERMEYWDREGNSLKMNLLKAPLHYARIGSRFSNAKFNPNYKVKQSNSVVSYAAPTGTPDIAVADGEVVYRGSNGRDGRTVKIEHDGDLVTVFMHLNRYARDLKRGERVSQGDLIGYVGSTGGSTEPHLEYAMWQGGTPIDPLEVEPRPMSPISEQNRDAFDETCREVVAELNGEVKSNPDVK